MSPSDRDPVSAAGFVVIHDEPAGTRMLLLRNRKRGDWGFPKGHLDPGEDDYAGATRELLEETGISKFKLEPTFKHVVRYRVPLGREAGRWKTVTYFLASVPSADTEISDEHDQYQWAAADEAQTLLRHPNLRALAREAFGFWSALKA